MSYTIEYWDIPSGRGPYWIGPFSSLAEAQRAHSGYELRAADQLYLIREGRTPGSNTVVAAVIDRCWLKVPIANWWSNVTPHTLRLLRSTPSSPLTNRLVIEVISAGGSVEGFISAAGQRQERLSPAHQRVLRPQLSERPLTAPNTSSRTPRRARRAGALLWVLLAAATTAILMGRRR